MWTDAEWKQPSKGKPVEENGKKGWSILRFCRYGLEGKWVCYGPQSSSRLIISQWWTSTKTRTKWKLKVQGPQLISIVPYASSSIAPLVHKFKIQNTNVRKGKRRTKHISQTVQAIQPTLKQQIVASIFKSGTKYYL